MSSVAFEPALIGVDWGTSSFRAFLMDKAGDILDSVSAPKGIMHVENGDFPSALHNLIGQWTVCSSLPIIASGMITSRNGWVETPYVRVPSGAEELAKSLVKLDSDDGINLSFVTGMTTESNGAPDVMRGEETQIIGAAASGMDDGIFVLPGTHSKWITVADGKIEDYSTFMTGEVFGALRSHTILGTLIEEGPFSDEGFRLGAAEGLEQGGNLLSILFHVRTQPLFGRIPRSMVADYLSGILIGAEIGAIRGQGGVLEEVTIICRDDLALRYEAALEIAGIKHRRSPEDIVARGHFLIAKSAGLVS